MRHPQPDDNPYTLGYDPENRLVSVSGAATASFVYDGDGNRVQGTVAGVTTVYIGKAFEYSAGVGKKYFSAAGTMIAMRSGSNGLQWLAGDHLGSTSVSSDSSGLNPLRQTYYPWGENRYPTTSSLPTTMRYTGQRAEPGLGGIYFYQARWYDPVLGRFLSPDTIIPTGVQGLDRYAYANNNPVNYIDPSGHIGIGVAILAFIAFAGVVAYGAYVIERARPHYTTAHDPIYGPTRTPTPHGPPYQTSPTPTLNSTASAILTAGPSSLACPVSSATPTSTSTMVPSPTSTLAPADPGEMINVVENDLANLAPGFSGATSATSLTSSVMRGIPRIAGYSYLPRAVSALAGTIKASNIDFSDLYYAASSYNPPINPTAAPIPTPPAPTRTPTPSPTSPYTGTPVPY